MTPSLPPVGDGNDAYNGGADTDTYDLFSTTCARQGHDQPDNRRAVVRTAPDVEVPTDCTCRHDRTNVHRRAAGSDTYRRDGVGRQLTGSGTLTGTPRQSTPFTGWPNAPATTR